MNANTISIGNMTIINLSQALGLIEIKGQDAERFLQGQLTCDVREIKTLDKKPSLGAFCNLKGRIRALFRIIKTQEGFLLSLPIALLSYAIQELKKYARFSKVEINDVTQQWSRLGIITQTIIIQTEDLPELLNLNDQHKIILLEHPSSFDSNINSNTASVTSYKYEILVPNPNYCNKVIDDLSNNTNNTYNFSSDNISNNKSAFFDLGNFHLGNMNDWILQDIRAGIPEIWLETKETFLPHPLNLPALNAVSFTKGCYCGQEIIARMQYLGNIKRGLQYHLFENLQSLPAPGSQIVNDQTFVVSSALNEKGQVECLLESSFKI